MCYFCYGINEDARPYARLTSQKGCHCVWLRSTIATAVEEQSEMTCRLFNHVPLLDDNLIPILQLMEIFWLNYKYKHKNCREVLKWAVKLPFSLQRTFDWTLMHNTYNSWM
jgi:hypothetical protein